MKFDKNKMKAWRARIDSALPNLFSTLEETATDVLLIGAVAIEVYELQGWIPPLSRQTGDIDLSVGLVNDRNDYLSVKKRLVENGYVNKASEHSYRLYPPKALPGAIAYIDLLAHPEGGASEATARDVMGVGPNFSFAGFGFAKKHAFQIAEHIWCPHPIGLIALKMASFRDVPGERTKDLADVAELSSGLVEHLQHFELQEEWAKMKSAPEAQEVRANLSVLADGSSTAWDLENARQSLLMRAFSGEDIDELIPARIRELVDQLADPESI